MKISRQIKKWLGEYPDIKATPLAYVIESGGIFVKKNLFKGGNKR